MRVTIEYNFSWHKHETNLAAAAAKKLRFLLRKTFLSLIWHPLSLRKDQITSTEAWKAPNNSILSLVYYLGVQIMESVATDIYLSPLILHLFKSHIK